MYKDTFKQIVMVIYVPNEEALQELIQVYYSKDVSPSVRIIDEFLSQVSQWTRNVFKLRHVIGIYNKLRTLVDDNI